MKRSILLVEYSNFKRIQTTQGAHRLVCSLKPSSNIYSLTLTLETLPSAPHRSEKQGTLRLLLPHSIVVLGGQAQTPSYKQLPILRA